MYFFQFWEARKKRFLLFPFYFIWLGLPPDPLKVCHFRIRQKLWQSAETGSISADDFSICWPYLTYAVHSRPIMCIINGANGKETAGHCAELKRYPIFLYFVSFQVAFFSLLFSVADITLQKFFCFLWKFSHVKAV